jgi:hypothetical protein
MIKKLDLPTAVIVAGCVLLLGLFFGEFGLGLLTALTVLFAYGFEGK